MNTFTRDHFIRNAKRFHGDKYDYSLVEYKNNKTLVTIICPEHGSFQKTPSSHSRGAGCPKCLKRCTNTAEFIAKSRSIYGERYLYEMVEYTHTEAEVIIICPEHGSFLVKPEIFLRGSACILCDGGSAKLKAQKAQAYLDKFRQTHGDRYDYSSVIYTGNQNKVAIKCKVHGIFHQTPLSHAKGSGCIHCFRERKTKQK